jgi:predicted SPOUT superfamily RNA methylase MTH1
MAIKMRNINLNIAIASNVLEDCSDLRAKTLKIGQIARAAVIFKVRKIIIYSISKAFLTKYSNDIELIKGILEYLDCPQYLRRIIFPKLPILKYVGVLPPLRTPHHPLENTLAKIQPNSIREGTVLYSNSSYSELEIGLDMSLKLQIPNLPKKRRIILKLEKRGNSISGFPITREEVKDYWGYETQIFKDSLQNFTSLLSDYIAIAASKQGNPLRMKDIEFFRELKEKTEILILFGSPNFGLFDIFKTQNLDLVNSVDFIINIAPNQGTQTVRVEEAIYSALSIINCILFL